MTYRFIIPLLLVLASIDAPGQRQAMPFPPCDGEPCDVDGTIVDPVTVRLIHTVEPLPFILFDLNSAEIPEYYRLFDGPLESDPYRQTHRALLAVIADRLRHDSTRVLALRGTISQTGEDSETPSLGLERARAVRSWLVDSLDVPDRQVLVVDREPTPWYEHLGYPAARRNRNARVEFHEFDHTVRNLMPGELRRHVRRPRLSIRLRDTAMCTLPRAALVGLVSSTDDSSDIYLLTAPAFDIDRSVDVMLRESIDRFSIDIGLDSTAAIRLSYFLDTFGIDARSDRMAQQGAASIKRYLTRHRRLPSTAISFGTTGECRREARFDRGESDLLDMRMTMLVGRPEGKPPATDSIRYARLDRLLAEAVVQQDPFVFLEGHRVEPGGVDRPLGGGLHLRAVERGGSVMWVIDEKGETIYKFLTVNYFDLGKRRSNIRMDFVRKPWRLRYHHDAWLKRFDVERPRGIDLDSIRRLYGEGNPQQPFGYRCGYGGGTPQVRTMLDGCDSSERRINAIALLGSILPELRLYGLEALICLGEINTEPESFGELVRTVIDGGIVRTCLGCLVSGDDTERFIQLFVDADSNSTFARCRPVDR